MPILPLRIV